MSVRDRIRDAFYALAGRPKVVAYDAGRVQRRDPDFTPLQIGPNSLADQTLAMVWRRTRWLTDNHPLMAGACQTIEDNTAGTSGIMFQPATPWPELNKALKDRWYRFAEAVDLTRTRSLAEEQRLFLREVFATGEALVHRPVIAAFGGRGTHVAVEVLPAEQVDVTLNSVHPGGVRGMAPGNVIRQGVELDALKRPVAYHVLLEHPSDGWMGAPLLGDTRRLSVMGARLAYRRRRAGQVRGVPAMVASVLTVRLEDAHAEAAILQAMAAACLGVWIEGGNTAPVLARGTNQAPIVDARGRTLERLEPGMIGRLPAGMKPTALNHSLPGPMFDKVTEILARAMGAGIGLGYSDLTRDESKTTFAASSNENLKGRKFYRPLQEFVADHHTRPLYEDWLRFELTFRSEGLPLTAALRAAWMADPRGAGFFATAVIAPGWEWANPSQQAQADQLNLGNGTRSAAEICADRGRHFEDVIDEQIAFEVYDRDRRAAAGLPPRAAAKPAGATDEPPEEPQRGTRENEDLHEARARALEAHR